MQPARRSSPKKIIGSYILTSPQMKAENFMVKFAERILCSFRDMKIMKKLVAIYFISVITPILFFGSYLATNMYNAVLESAISQSSTNNARISDRLDELLYLLTNISDKIYYDNELKILVQNQYTSFSQIISTYKNYETLDDFIKYYPQIDSIMIYTDNITMLNSGHFTKVTDEIKKLDWYSDAANSHGEILWKCVPDNFTKYYNMSLVRKININQSRAFFVLAINISNSYLNSLAYDEDSKAFILEGHENILFSSRRREIGDDYAVLGINAPLDGQDRPLFIDYNGNRSILHLNSFQPERAESRIQVVTITPVNDIKSESFTMLLRGLLITALFLIPTVAIISLFSKSFSRRIQFIHKEMQKAVTGDFNISTDFNGRDEIGELHQGIAKMIEGIQKLLREIYEEKLQKEKLVSRQKEIELKLLSSQINPHFLFNTLETIRMKANVNGDREVAQAIKILGNSMRHILEITNACISLASELDQVKSYLEIQKFRFGEKIQYRITVEYDINPAQYFILPLLLQPIVENAFIHGLENQEQGGNINISLYKDGERLAISVEDNGAGLEDEVLAALKTKIDEEIFYTGKSIGLCNVNQRIKIFYGAQYGLTITSVMREGTNVTMYLPLAGRVISNV